MEWEEGRGCACVLGAGCVVPGFMQDKSEADLERMKSTVMLCYGYVSYHSPPQ